VFLTNVLAWTIDSGRIGEIPVGLAVAVSTVMAQRLLLNIRANFAQRAAGGVIGADSSDLDAACGSADALRGGGAFTLSAMEFEGVGGFDALATAGTAVDAEIEMELEVMAEKEAARRKAEKGKQSMEGEKGGFGPDVEANAPGRLALPAAPVPASVPARGRGMSTLSGSTAINSPQSPTHSCGSASGSSSGSVYASAVSSPTSEVSPASPPSSSSSSSSCSPSSPTPSYSIPAPASPSMHSIHVITSPALRPSSPESSTHASSPSSEEAQVSSPLSFSDSLLSPTSPSSTLAATAADIHVPLER